MWNKLSKQRGRFLFVLLCIILFAVFASGTISPNNGTAAQVVNRIVLENQKPGTTSWQSPGLLESKNEPKEEYGTSYADSGSVSGALWTDSRDIKGYANLASINVGDSIEFHVSSKKPSYQINIYRMGYYNGTGSTLVKTVTGFTGVDYGVPTPDPQTGMIAATWPVAYTLQTDNTWTTGVYLAKLTAVGGNLDGYIIFIVRDDSSTADILYQVAVTTYQSYNNWGGKSLYDFNSTGGRSYKASYDRPYELWQGSGHFFEGDYNMIFWLESKGYNISYATSIDLEASAGLLNGHKVFLSNYHDEYWSKNMRDHLTSARDGGKHLAFFDSNNIYWQIRFESSAGGVPNRVQVCYKNVNLDPVHTTTPSLTTVLWRDAPVSQPENALLGVMYDGNFDDSVNYPYVVANSSHWIYTGTNLHDGDSIPLVVGDEYDKIWSNGLTPANLVMLSNSPIAITSSTSNASIYTAASGALVFDASTNRWAKLLSDSAYEDIPVDARIQKITQNLLDHMISTSPLVTPTYTLTPTTTNTPTSTSTATNTPTSTATSTSTSTSTATATSTATDTPTSTATSTATNTATATSTATKTSTSTSTYTKTSTPTATLTASATQVTGNPTHFYFGTCGSWTPLTGDWDGDGKATVGIYNNAEFYLTNNNATVASHFYFGSGGSWQAITGDWDNSGSTSVGIYNNGEFFLTNNNATVASHFYFGPGGTWKAIAGDWDGNGSTTVGIYNNNEFYLTNNNATVASHFYFGPGGTWKVLMGDWDGNGTTSLGINNSSEFYLTNNNSAVAAHFYFGPGGVWKAIAGDWDGNGTETVGIYNCAEFFLSNNNSTVGPVGIAPTFIPVP